MELRQLEAQANSQQILPGSHMGHMDAIVDKNGGMPEFGPDGHREQMGTVMTEKSLNHVSQEVLESASYRSSGILRSMSATNMSMPFLDKVQVGKEPMKKRATFQLDLNSLSANYDKDIYAANQAQQISHQRLASTRTENKKSRKELLPPIGQSLR